MTYDQGVLNAKDNYDKQYMRLISESAKKPLNCDQLLAQVEAVGEAVQRLRSAYEERENCLVRQRSVRDDTIKDLHARIAELKK